MNERERDAFQDALDRYGADLEKWPPKARARAESWLAGSSQARELLAEARRLDDVLRADRPGASAKRHALRQRILSAVSERAGSTSQGRGGGALVEAARRWIHAHWLRPALAASASLALGFVIGLGTLPEDSLAEDLTWASFDYVYESEGPYQDE